MIYSTEGSNLDAPNHMLETTCGATGCGPQPGSSPALAQDSFLEWALDRLHDVRAAAKRPCCERCPFENLVRSALCSLCRGCGQRACWAIGALTYYNISESLRRLQLKGDGTSRSLPRFAPAGSARRLLQPERCPAHFIVLQAATSSGGPASRTQSSFSRQGCQQPQGW